MRRPLLFALILPVLALAFTGCGKQEPAVTPVACLGGPHQWFDALNAVNTGGSESTETKVNLGGESLISDCIPPDQAAGRQETVGRTALVVATRLARAYRTGGSASAGSAWEAGYLVGALERGAKRSQGIHATLVERIRSAATNGLDRMSDNERNEYDRGYKAGLKSG